MNTRELAGPRIGQALLILSVLATLPNLVRFGFLPIYWRKRGFFRWHMASGFFLSITYPYFALCLLRMQPANLVLALGNALATIACCLSGLRLVSLLKRRDVRVRRFFANNGFNILAGGLLASGLVLHRLSFHWATLLLFRLSAALALATSAVAMSLFVLELLSHLRPVPLAAPEEHSQAGPMEKMRIRDLLDLFRFPSEDSSTVRDRTSARGQLRHLAS